MTFSDLRLANKLAPFLFSRLHGTYGHKVGTESHYFSVSFHFEVRLSVFPEGSNYKTFLLSTSDMCLMMVRAELCQSAKISRIDPLLKVVIFVFHILMVHEVSAPKAETQKVWETCCFECQL